MACRYNDGFLRAYARPTQDGGWLFLADSGTLSHMDKAEHAARLRAAMGNRGLDNTTVADSVGVQPRTVTNWRRGATLPSDTERAKLRNLLGPYDEYGDPVEVAIRNSGLVGFRQTKVIGYYQEQMHEQQRESAV